MEEPSKRLPHTALLRSQRAISDLSSASIEGLTAVNTTATSTAVKPIAETIINHEEAKRVRSNGGIVTSVCDPALICLFAKNYLIYQSPHLCLVLDLTFYFFSFPVKLLSVSIA